MKLMKLVFSIFTISIIFIAMDFMKNDDNYFFYSYHHKINLNIRDNYFILKSRNDNITSLLESNNCQVVEKRLAYNTTLIKSTDNNAMIYSILKEHDDIEFIDKVFEFEDGRYVVLCNEILLKPKSENENILQSFAEKYDGELIRKNQYGPLYFTLKFKWGDAEKLLIIANELYKTGLFDYAIPDFVSESFLSGDPYLACIIHKNSRFFSQDIVLY